MSITPLTREFSIPEVQFHGADLVYSCEVATGYHAD